MILTVIQQVGFTLAACTGACSTQNMLVDPVARGGPSLAAPVATDSACRSLVFTMGDNHTPGTATFPNRTTCGNGLVLIPVPNGVVAGFSPRQIGISLRILNRTTSTVRSPIRLVLPKSGIVVIGGGSSSKVTPGTPDTLRTDGTGVWLIDYAGLVRPPGDSTYSQIVVLKVGSPVQSARLTFQVLASTVDVVPAVAPDSTPAWFALDSNYSATGMLKRVLDVRFLPTATQAQKEAAIDSVGGVVVGGYHINHEVVGVYTVHMPGITSDSALLARRAQLLRQPGVGWALLLERGEPSGVRPQDDSTWGRASWSMNKDLSSGVNWAFEELSLPLAWGCQTGMQAPGLGVIESRLPAAGEFVVNARQYLASPLPKNSAQERMRAHGKWVMSLLAAKANDSRGGAGVLWSAQVDPVALRRDTSETTKRISEAIDSLVLRGDSIILTTVHPQRAPVFTTDTSRQGAWADRVWEGLTAAGTRPSPLLVVSAGNDNRDVAASAYGRLKSLLPSSVLIVGASEARVGAQRTRWGGPGLIENLDHGSNHGALVDVYAPGAAVGIADLDSLATLFHTGSSYAAALVAGIAGLLKAFDPRLDPASIKSLIVQGAVAGGVVVGNTGTGGPKYLANAHESLRLAAQATGTPLCGNRIWAEGQHTIKVERGSTEETIYTSPDTVTSIYTTHGGRRIDFQARPGLKGSLTFGPSGWSSSYFATPFADADWSGSAWSFLGRTHDADSLLGPHTRQFGGIAGVSAGAFDVTLGTSFGSGRQLTSNFTVQLVPPDQTITTRRIAQVDSLGNFVRYNEVTSSQDPGNNYRIADVRTIPSPFNDRAVVIVNYTDFP